MSHIKKHIEEHEDGVCDPATCLVHKQQELQRKVNVLQGEYPPEYKGDDDLNRAIEGAHLLMEYNVLSRFAHEYPAKYEALRRALNDYERGMLNEGLDADDRDDEPYIPQHEALRFDGETATG